MLGMRINKYISSATDLSRRSADTAILNGRVSINGHRAVLGDNVEQNDVVTLDGRAITRDNIYTYTTILLNKPVGYVSSRQGQGGSTVYELLPQEHQRLNLVGRLDKDSSGLILLTNDGDLANQLTHPRYAKTKIYEISLDKPLEPLHQQMVSDHGIQLDDGPSKLGLMRLDDTGTQWQVTMSEGRNRQIRRTFAALGYNVVKLHRTDFGPYKLSGTKTGEWRLITD